MSSSKKYSLIADTTFYLMFIDDIKMPPHLWTILEHFNAHLTPNVVRELDKSKDIKSLTTLKKVVNVFSDQSINLGNALLPFFSKKQKERGEHELIVLAFVFHNLAQPFVFILDDADAREFVEKNVTCLLPVLTRTGAFICDCCEVHKVYTKDTALAILEAIGKSKFRIPADALAKLIQRVKS